MQTTQDIIKILSLVTFKLTFI